MDTACKTHDIEYQSKTNSEDRYLADKRLEEAAAKRIVASDASIGERVVSAGVVLAMKAKRMLTKGRRGVKTKRNVRKTAARRQKKNKSRRKLKSAVRTTAKRSKCYRRPKKTRIIETPSAMASST